MVNVGTGRINEIPGNEQTRWELEGAQSREELFVISTTNTAWTLIKKKEKDLCWNAIDCVCTALVASDVTNLFS